MKSRAKRIEMINISNIIRPLVSLRFLQEKIKIPVKIAASNGQIPTNGFSNWKTKTMKPKIYAIKAYSKTVAVPATIQTRVR